MVIGIDITVGMNYVKYDQLGLLVMSSYQGSNATELNIFVDINSIIRPLFGSANYQIKDPLELSSQIINLCAHYRNFFRRMDVVTKFYLVYGLNCPEANNILVKGYNHVFIESYMKRKDVRDMVENNMKALEVLCPYLPGIYFFNVRDNETSAFIHHIIKKLELDNKQKYPLTENLVISKDVLCTQLIPECNVKMLRPKKIQGGDQSFIISHDNFWIAFMSKMNNVKIPNICIPDIFISNILAMTRVPERCMSSIKSIPHAYGIIEKMYTLGYLSNTDKVYNQSSINSVLQIMQVNHNPTELEFRWKAISSKFQAENIIANNPAYNVIRCDDLNDIKSLHSIANREYANCPIDLERL